MPFDKSHWQRPRNTIATRYEHDDIAYATHGAMVAVDAIRRLAIPPDQARKMHLLDYGCGTGRIARVLASYFGSVTAYDPVPECIAEAKRECSIPILNLTYTTDLEATKFEMDKGIDVVVAVNVMEHLNPKDQDEMIATIRRITKPGATLLLWYHMLFNRKVLQKWFQGDWDLEDDCWMAQNPASTIQIRSFAIQKPFPGDLSP